MLIVSTKLRVILNNNSVQTNKQTKKQRRRVNTHPTQSPWIPSGFPAPLRHFPAALPLTIAAAETDGILALLLPPSADVPGPTEIGEPPGLGLPMSRPPTGQSSGSHPGGHTWPSSPVLPALLPHQRMLQHLRHGREQRYLGMLHPRPRPSHASRAPLKCHQRPDGISMVPWRHGRVLDWDATCPDTFTPILLIYNFICFGRAQILCSQTPHAACARLTRNSRLLQSAAW